MALISVCACLMDTPLRNLPSTMRKPCPRFGSRTSGGYDPDDGVRVLIDAERSPNHVGASGEALLPERITENEHMRQAGFTLLLAESPAKLRQHAKQFENSGGALNGRN